MNPNGQRDRSEVTNDDRSAINTSATLSSRFFAMVVDGLLVGAFIVIVSKTLGTFDGRGLVMQFLAIAISFIYYGYFESRYSTNTTFGKRLLNIQLVNAAGKKISFVRAGLRAIITTSFTFVISLLIALYSYVFSEPIFTSKCAVIFLVAIGNLLLAFSVADLLFAFFSPECQRIMDVFFGTFVIDKKYVGVAKNPEKITKEKIVRWSLFIFGLWCVTFFAYRIFLF